MNIIYKPLRYLDYVYILKKPGVISLCIALSVDVGDEVIYKLAVSRYEDTLTILTRPLTPDYCSKKESISVQPNMLDIFWEIANNNCDWKYAEVAVNTTRAPKKGHDLSLDRIEYLRWEHSSDYVYTKAHDGYYVLADRESKIEAAIDSESAVYCMMYINSAVDRHVKSWHIDLLSQYAKHINLVVENISNKELLPSTIKTRIAKEITNRLLSEKPKGLKRLLKEEADALIKSLVYPLESFFADKKVL